MKSFGLNFGHDAGFALVESTGFRLYELEKLLDVRHACGGTPGAEEILIELIRSHNHDLRGSSIGIADYYAGRATYANAVISPTLSSASWASRSRPRADMLVTPVQAEGLLGLAH